MTRTDARKKRTEAKKQKRKEGLEAKRLQEQQDLNNKKLEVLKQYPIQSWPWPRIVVGIPIERAMSHASQVFFPFMAIAAQGVPMMKFPYGRTDLVRNKMAMELLRSDFTHLLMLDFDHVHPQYIVQQLAKWVLLSPEVKVVGGLNFRRGAPFDPCAFIQGEDGKFYPPIEWGQGLVEVDQLGTGSILIAREVFEVLDPPWFFNSYDRVWEDAWPGEDIGFSNKCREKGIKLYVDTTTTSPHMIDAWVDESSYRQYVAENIGPEGTHKIIRAASDDEE